MAMTANELPNSRPTLTGSTGGSSSTSFSKINNTVQSGSSHGSSRWRSSGRRRPQGHSPPKKLLSNSRSSGRGGIRGLESSLKKLDANELEGGATGYDTDECESSDLEESTRGKRSSLTRSLRLSSSRRSRSGGRKTRNGSLMGGSLRESRTRATSIGETSDEDDNSTATEVVEAAESRSTPSSPPKRPGRRPSLGRRSILLSRSKSAVNQGDLKEMRRLATLDNSNNSNNDNLNESQSSLAPPASPTIPPTAALPKVQRGGGRKPLLSSRSKSCMNQGDLKEMRRMVSYPTNNTTSAKFEPPSRLKRKPPLRTTISQSFRSTAVRVQRSKSSCPELMQMQQSLGTTRTNAMTSRAAAAGGGGEKLSSKSDRPTPIRRSRSSVLTSMRRQRSADTEPGAGVPRDPFFVEMTKLNPTDAADRAKFDDFAVKRTLKTNPDAARATYDFPVGGRGNLTVSRYPLSALVALGASVDTLRLAVRANPHALEGDIRANRSNALHTACAFNSELDVLKFLYSKHPTAIGETTRFVFLPVHNACQANNPSLDMIKFLVQNYPEGLMAINKLGDTPLRTAQRNDSVSSEVLTYLENETHRVFDECDENKRRKAIIQARQSWGSIPALKKEMFGDQGSSLELKNELFGDNGSSLEMKEERRELFGNGSSSLELSTHSACSIPDLEEMASDVSSF